jgi:hypothetical protein
MSFKNWTYWLKGGIIGVITYLVVYIASFIIPSGGDPPGNILSWIILLIAFPTFSLKLNQLSPSVFMLMILPIYFFIFGAIIGWVIGKIKR